jgi:hypothetical protein
MFIFFSSVFIVLIHLEQPCFPLAVTLFWQPHVIAAPQFAHFAIVVGFYIV